MESPELDHDRRAPAWLRLALVGALAAVVHQACALNPQPIPPDELEPSADAGSRGEGSSGTGFPNDNPADSGASSSGGGGGSSSGGAVLEDAGSDAGEDDGGSDAGDDSDAGENDGGSDAGEDAGDGDDG